MLKLFNKYKIIVILILLSLISLYLTKQSPNQQAIAIIKEESKETPSQGSTFIPTEEGVLDTADRTLLIPVYLCGAVYKPDVYQVEETAILKDLITLAGGLTQEADLTQINLAQAIKAHDKIYIPKIGEEIDKIPNSYENEERAKSNHLININRASVAELMSLPGIGEVKAQQIVQYREQNGPFLAREDLMNVSGVGNKIYEGLQGFITIE